MIPLHLPPGDTSTERTVQIDGTSEQIESAKQLVNDVISEVNFVVCWFVAFVLFTFAHELFLQVVKSITKKGIIQMSHEF